MLPLGVSQIDGGTRIGVGAYRQSLRANAMPDQEQFSIGDDRTLDNIVAQTCDMGYIPSFCTACYRAGRTGEHFMKVAKSKFVHNYCVPNALFTLKEYLLDYASPGETRAKGRPPFAGGSSSFAASLPRQDRLDAQPDRGRRAGPAAVGGDHALSSGCQWV